MFEKKKVLKITLVPVFVLSGVMVLSACNKNNSGSEIYEPTIVSEPESVTPGEPAVQQNEAIVADETITADEALLAVRNYCFSQNPDLKNMVGNDEYTVYWEIESADENESVILYRAYTGAQIRYYVSAATGDVRTTEFVPGITEEEQPSDESFNANDYLVSVDGI